MNEAISTVTPTGAETGISPDTLARLASAIRSLGADAELRDRVVDICRAAERHFGLRHGDVRETTTGPIVDSLHAPGMLLRKELADGTLFDFTYRSKIARDFVLSPEARPDHVWEPQTTRLLLHFARHAQRAVVGGGYIGDHAVLIARAMRDNGGVCHAFEPNAESAGLMQHNAANNGVANLVVSQFGLWNEDNGHLRLVGGDSHAYPVRATDADLCQTIPTVTLDTYGKAQSIDKLDLLMLDIEGGEQSALEGAIGFLRRPGSEAPVVVFEIHRSYVDWSNGLERTPLIRLMLDAGYKVFAIRDFQSNVPTHGCMVELLPLDAVYLEGPPHGFNMLAVKDQALLDTALFRKCRDKSPKLLLYKSPALHHPTEWLDRLPEWLRGTD